MNGLTKPSSIDTLQLRGASLDRFLRRIGTMDAYTMEEITAAIAVVIDISNKGHRGKLETAIHF